MEGLNSQELRDRVYQKVEEDPKSKAVLLAPFMRDGIPASAPSTIVILLAHRQKMFSRFTISSIARSAEGAKLVADIVQSEYEKMHKSKSLIESVRNLLESC